MKKRIRIFLSILLAVFVLCQNFGISATTFTRKFNGVQAIEGSVKAPGSSTYSNNIVTMNLPDAGSLCWSYVPNATDFAIQFRVDVDSDPEFDWLGINLTNDGYALLGNGTGLSTIFFRTGDGYVSRVVEDVSGKKWDDVVNTKQINEGSLYDEKNPAPHEDYKFGYGDWITLTMKKTGTKWDLRINGVDMVKNRYNGFDSDMTRLLGSGTITLSFFTSGVPGVIQVKSFTNTAVSSSSTSSSKSSSKASSVASSASTSKNSGISSASSLNSSTTGLSAESSSQSGQSAVSQPSGESGGDVSNSSTTASEGTNTSIQSTGSNGSESDNTDTTGGSLIWIIVIAAVVVAGSGTAFVIMKKKK